MLLAVTIGLGDALSGGLVVVLASALAAAVKINERASGRLKTVEGKAKVLRKDLDALREHDQAATKERHALELRIVALESQPGASGVYEAP